MEGLRTHSASPFGQKPCQDNANAGGHCTRTRGAQRIGNLFRCGAVLVRGGLALVRSGAGVFRIGSNHFRSRSGQVRIDLVKWRAELPSSCAVVVMSGADLGKDGAGLIKVGRDLDKDGLALYRTERTKLGSIGKLAKSRA